MTRLAFIFCSLLHAISIGIAPVAGFSYPRTSSKALRKTPLKNRQQSSSSQHAITTALFTSSVPSTSDESDDPKEAKKKLVRKEGGISAFTTKYGALNLYAIYFGLLSISLGIVWYSALACCQLLYFFSRGRIDKKRRIPTIITHMWGTALMRFSRGFPTMENLDILKKLDKQKRAAMFVANHNSWQDINFLGAAIGWRNYKFIAKKELLKVPILAKGIIVPGHITVDRKDRREQLLALRKGIEYLKNNVNLCTFPEGTRSRTGRLLDFKAGAFLMASKAEAPVVPLAIVASGKAHPSHWMFPCRPSHGIAKVVVCDPIETKDKTEELVQKEVREAIIAALPEDQRPRGGN